MTFLIFFQIEFLGLTLFREKCSSLLHLHFTDIKCYKYELQIKVTIQLILGLSVWLSLVMIQACLAQQSPPICEKIAYQKFMPVNKTNPNLKNENKMIQKLIQYLYNEYLAVYNN